MALEGAQFRWGTNNENILSFDHPTLLDVIRNWRTPSPGSRRRRNAPGVTTTWMTGRDFCMACRARWFKKSLYSGPLGLQAFLDWAQENPFRFVPDKTLPLFYVDDVYLEAPFESPEPELEPADSSQSIDLLLRHRTVDLGLIARGLMFEYQPGASLADPVAYTFTRATIANYRDVDGKLAQVASGVLRDRNYVGTVRTALLERAGTNLCLQSENFGTTWVATGTPTRTAGALIVGNLSLDLIGDDSATASEFYDQAIGFTGNGTRAYSVFVKKGTSTKVQVEIDDVTAGHVRRGMCRVTFGANGVPTAVEAGNGAQLGIEAMRDGVYRILCRAQGVVAANTNLVRVFPVSEDLGVGATGDVYLGGVQVEDAVVPSSYLKTVTAQVTRNADTLNRAFSHVPQAMWVYQKFVERGAATTPTGQFSHPVHIGDFNVWRHTVYFDGNSAKYTASIGNSTQQQLAEVSAVPVIGDLVEHLTIFRADASVQLRQSINGGAEAVATSPVNTLGYPASFGGLLFDLFAGSHALFGHVHTKVGPGDVVNTLALARSK